MGKKATLLYPTANARSLAVPDLPMAYKFLRCLLGAMAIWDRPNNPKPVTTVHSSVLIGKRNLLPMAIIGCPLPTGKEYSVNDKNVNQTLINKENQVMDFSSKLWFLCCLALPKMLTMVPIKRRIVSSLGWTIETR